MSVDKVKKYLERWGMQDKVMEFPVSSATVEEAAMALHCEGKRIAKTLSFKVDDKPILIVMAGDAKVDNHKYKDLFHKKASMLKAEEVEEWIGYPVGGVCPFGVSEQVTVYLDESLRRFETVFPACGSRNSAIEMTMDELEDCSGASKWIDVSKLME